MTSTKLDHTASLGYLETIGRVSGQPRETEIWFAVDGQTLFMLSGGGLEKDWVKNFQRQPRVRFRVGDARVAGVARVVADAEEEARARRLVAAKYYGFDPDGDAPLPNEWSRTATPVAIDLDPEG